MNVARIMMGGLFGGLWGWAIAKFIIAGDWAMAAVVAGLFVAVFYLACWIESTGK